MITFFGLAPAALGMPEPSGRLVLVAESLMCTDADVRLERSGDHDLLLQISETCRDAVAALTAHHIGAPLTVTAGEAVIADQARIVTAITLGSGLFENAADLYDAACVGEIGCTPVTFWVEAETLPFDITDTVEWFNGDAEFTLRPATAQAAKTAAAGIETPRWLLLTPHAVFAGPDQITLNGERVHVRDAVPESVWRPKTNRG